MSTANLFAIHDLESRKPVPAAKRAGFLASIAKKCTADEAAIIEECGEYLSWSSGGEARIDCDEAGTGLRNDLSDALLGALNKIGGALGGWLDGGSAYWRTDDGCDFYRRDFSVEDGELVDDGRELEGACGETFDNISCFKAAQVQAFIKENDLDVDFDAYDGDRKAKNWKALALIDWLRNRA